MPRAVDQICIMQGSRERLPGKEEDLSASLPGAIDVAQALHQLLHALQVQACMHRTSPAASNILMQMKILLKMNMKV